MKLQKNEVLFLTLSTDDNMQKIDVLHFVICNFQTQIDIPSENKQKSINRWSFVFLYKMGTLRNKKKIPHLTRRIARSFRRVIFQTAQLLPDYKKTTSVKFMGKLRVD